MPSLEHVDAAWIREHGRFLRTLGRALLDGDAQGEDVVQDALATAISQERQGAGIANLAAWLRTVTKRGARRARRERLRRDERERAVARPEAQASAADAAARAEILRRVAEVVAGLREPYREALLLRFVEDLPPRAISARLGVPVPTVDSRIQRGLALARAELERTSRGDARRWSEGLGLALGFEPLGAPPSAVAASESVAVTGLLAMKLPLAFLVCVVAVVLAVGAWLGVAGDRVPKDRIATAVALDGLDATSSDSSADAGRVAVADLVRDKDPAAEAPVALRRFCFRVTDEDGRPLEGVVGVWNSSAEADAFGRGDRVPDSPRATSNARGELTLEVEGEGEGLVRFQRDGFEPASCRLALSTAAPWGVVLHRSDEVRRLRFVSFETGAPVGAARVSARGAEIATSGPDGVVVVPSWVASDERLRVESSDTCTANVQFARLESDVVRLRAACDVTFDFELESGDAPGAVSLACRPVESSDPPWAGIAARAVEGTRTVVRVPRGVELECFAIDELGNGAETRRMFRAAAEVCTLTLDASDCLDVLLSDEDGAPIAGAHTDVSYPDFAIDALSLLSGVDGVLRVPAASRTSFVRIAAPGFAGVGLKPTSSSVPKAGELALTLVREVTGARVHLVDPLGTAIPGVRVVAWSRDSGFRQFPEHHGAWPSGHDGWSISRMMGFEFTTDANGVAELHGLGEGEYDLHVSTPASYQFSAWVLPSAPSRVSVRSDLTITVESARPVPLELEVVDAESGRPVRGLMLRVPSMRLELPGVGNHWQGLVASTEREVIAIAPGVGSARVQLDGKPRGLKRVVIWPEEPTRVRIVGDAARSLADARLRAILFRPLDGGGFTQTGARGIELDDHAVGELLVGIDPPLFVRIDAIELDGRRIQFAPRELEWTPDRELTFTAVVRE